jgi:hypothetical protein
MKGLSMIGTKALTMLFIALMIGVTVSDVTSRATTVPVLPNPVLYLTALEPFSTGGKNFIRYKYSVDNLDKYPDELFAAAPELPPCGLNTKAARTWVDIYDSRGKRLYGFCAFSKAADLNGLWFALEDDVIPPSFVYIEMNDRKTNTKYKSNLADTAL